MVDTHSDQPLARGFLPFRPARGTCEIRGGAANLWYAAAKALGFVVSTLRCTDPLFVGYLTGFCAGAKRLTPPPGRFRRPRQLPDVVFSDLAGLPIGPGAGNYWEDWTTTHVFYCLGSDDSVLTLSETWGDFSVSPPHLLGGGRHAQLVWLIARRGGQPRGDGPSSYGTRRATLGSSHSRGNHAGAHPCSVV